MPFTNNDLNAPQREAVAITEGPLLILAGAGSGKTRTLTCRVAHLLEKGVRPWNILAITFTNKAAEEMKNRVVESAPEGAKVWVATFHSTCLRILRYDADRLGYQAEFSVYDTDDSRVLMRRIIKELDYNPKEYREREVLRTISSWKNKMISVEDKEAESGGRYREERMARLYREYQKRLMAANAMDFDDLLLNAVKLFEENPDVLAKWRDRFRYVMVDEYQDTNPAQFRFVQLLAEEHRNLCVVGDDDQSIYRFRGAEIRNILSFESVFPEARVIRLEQNYRSTKNILTAANGVIANNTTRKEKTLWSDRETGAPVSWREYEDARDEARGIVKDIIAERESFPYGSCAVLYRTNAQSRVLEESFVAAGVPYRLIGGVGFYERREVKDCLSYLRIIANPRDDVSLRRIVNVPRRGIGDSSLEKLSYYAATYELSLLETMLRIDEFPELKKAAPRFRAFADLIMNLKAEALSLSVEALIERTLRESGYLEALKEEGDIEAEARLENLEELINKAADFGGEVGVEALTAFLSETSLVADVDELTDAADRVVLMTLHSAKGLEFPKVYISGMEQQVFPGDKVIYLGNEADIEEERRLCYVGITRAMDKLVLSGAARRMVNGEFRTHLISQFVEEIPEKVLKRDRVGLMRKEREYKESWDNENGFGRGKFSSRGSAGAFSRPAAAAAPAWQDFGDSFGFGFAGGGGIKPKKDSGKEILTEFAEGDRVVSRRFGAGSIAKVETGGKDTVLTVDFDKYGRKVLLAAFAALTREEKAE